MLGAGQCSLTSHLLIFRLLGSLEEAVFRDEGRSGELLDCEALRKGLCCCVSMYPDSLTSGPGALNSFQGDGIVQGNCFERSASFGEITLLLLNPRVTERSEGALENVIH